MVGVYIALIIAILLIPASFVAGIILGRECVRLGLQYQIEAKNGQKPSKPPSKRAPVALIASLSVSKSTSALTL